MFNTVDAHILHYILEFADEGSCELNIVPNKRHSAKDAGADNDI